MSVALILMYHQVDCPARSRSGASAPRRTSSRARWRGSVGRLSQCRSGRHREHVAGERPLSGNAVHITFDDGFVVFWITPADARGQRPAGDPVRPVG